MYDGHEHYTTDDVKDGTIDFLFKLAKAFAFLAGATSLYFLSTIIFK